MGMYEVWREAKRRLEKDPADPWLPQTVDALRDLALKDYIEAHAGLNTFEEPMELDQDEIREYLAGLDELRGTPKVGELEDQRREIALDADRALRQLSEKNWTGEHTYGQALDDAREVLRAVLSGGGFPALERFRCPMRYAVGGDQLAQVRCVYQLPHGDLHAYHDGSAEGIRWTDSQSVNPPRNYDEPGLSV